ncbi:MAG TPA: response regulator [Polyangia bacterium]|nr:response regulator [Polyangia bacterium]
MASAKNKVVLLVEDNPDDEELTKLAFEASHVMNEIIVARDGVEALDFLFVRGRHAHRDPTIVPQVVLLDLKIPKVSGLEVLRQVRANPATALIPVVVLTSSKEDEDLIRSYQLGANAYVRKPVDFGEFSEAAKQLGMFWLLMNETAPSPVPTPAK